MSPSPVSALATQGCSNWSCASEIRCSLEAGTWARLAVGWLCASAPWKNEKEKREIERKSDSEGADERLGWSKSSI